MPSNPQKSETSFEETTVLPRGRKARSVESEVLEKLAESARRGVGFARTAAPNVIDDLRRDLGSAAVRAKYEVTTHTEKISATHHRLTFAAKHKPQAETNS